MKDKIKISLLVMILVLAIIFFKNVSLIYLNAESYLENSGMLTGILIFSGLMILAILILPIPSSPFAVVAGIVFGSYIGMIITLISATIGATIAFIIGRFFLHNYFAKRFKKNKIYRKMLEEENKHLLKFIFFSRLIPKMPFDLVSYMAGITSMPIWKFALATFLGSIPIVFILTFFGELIESYRITVLLIFIILFIIYKIHGIIIHKRYYMRGY